MSLSITHIGTATMLLEIGALRYTMDHRDAVRAARALRPQQIIPIHYEGWRHFSEGQAAVEKAFTSARLPPDERASSPGYAATA